MRPLRIVWQRLVVSRGQTCPRCRSTQEALESAVVKLKAALGPLGFVPVLETRELDEDAFRGDPSESNRIWIAGRTLEEWLGARVGSSQCCAVCGPSEMSHRRGRGSDVRGHSRGPHPEGFAGCGSPNARFRRRFDGRSG
jgi:hypothetical protein